MSPIAIKIRKIRYFIVLHIMLELDISIQAYIFHNKVDLLDYM